MIKIYSKSEQAKGSFNFGRILEHKPIGFPQDGGELKPYSSLFYWAHAWSDEGGLIDQHPHKGFEIMSYIIKGEIQHYDNQLNGWKRLAAGDVQVIRAGNGIVHAEKLLPGSAMFQIWFDPDLNKTLSQLASYSDYSSTALPLTQMQGVRVKHIKGGGSPLSIESKVEFIQEWTFDKKGGSFDLDSRSLYNICLISGEATLDDYPVKTGDYIIISDAAEVKITPAAGGCKLFVICLPKDPGFKTYYDYMTG